MTTPDTLPRLDFDKIRYRQLLADGIAAVKSGDREQARVLLEKAASLSPWDARPWLWLSGATENPVEQRACLENALAADPNNSSAQLGLRLLSEKTDRQRVMGGKEQLPVRNSPQPIPAEAAQSHVCTKCGGHLCFDLETRQLRCEVCGDPKPVNIIPVTGHVEQVVDTTLVTSRAYPRIEAQQQLACQICGVILFLVVGKTVQECPNCGSRILFASAGETEQLGRQFIALMQVDRLAAQKILRDWLRKGFFVPDHLKKQVNTTPLQPAYYPFWSFMGTLELEWDCEINLGTNRIPRWIDEHGYEFENFKNILIPGLTALDEKMIAGILPFMLDDVVEFKPEYLAGWTALTYNRPLEEASLTARERVLRKVRRELESRVEVGREKRNLRSGITNWSSITHKLLLLPLWVGTFKYQGQEYRILINGQTGKISGEKPVDRFKVWASLALILLGLAALGLILVFLYLSLGYFGQ